MSEKLWYLKRCDLFLQLSEDAIRQVEMRSRARKFPRNSPIYLPADDDDVVYLLASGRAKICHLTNEGKQSILAFIEPGEIFGELSVLQESPRDEYAEAVEACTLVQIPGDVIRDLMEQNVGVSLGITKLIGLRRQRIERRLKNLLFLSNRQRLTHLLLELMEQYGATAQDGVQLTIKLSHQELSSIIGSTRESVTVVLGELQLDGLIKVGRRRITIRDPAALAKSVQRETPKLPSTRSVSATK